MCGDVGWDDPAWPEGQPRALSAPDVDRIDQNVFHREGEYWSLVFQGQTIRLQDLKGLRYLARLLARPGRDFHVLEIVADESGGAVEIECAAGKIATHIRRHALQDFEADRQALRLRQEELEAQLLASPAEGWCEAAAKAQYLIRLYAATAEGQSTIAAPGMNTSHGAVWK